MPDGMAWLLMIVLLTGMLTVLLRVELLLWPGRVGVCVGCIYIDDLIVMPSLIFLGRAGWLMVY